MDTIKSFPRRSFIMIMLFMSILLLLTDMSYDFGMDFFETKAGLVSGTDNTLTATDCIASVQRELKIPFISIAGGVFFGIGFLLWVALRLGMTGGAEQRKPAEASKKPVKPETPVENKQERMESDRRMYLHLLSVLQREGRLVDFFAEDLGLYEDAQIGAAVRNIQENCKKTMEKYLKPSAVMDQNEGDEVTIEASFNADEIKLIGNVSGNPPFKGILRHKGWKASKTELPKLSAGKDSKLISPAEVEIL